MNILTAGNKRSSVSPELEPSHHWFCNIILNCSFTVPIGIVCHCEAIWIGRKNRVLTCIAVVELFNQVDVPELAEAVVTVDLQLISLAVVVALDHLSSLVHIFGVLMPYILDGYTRRIRKSC